MITALYHALNAEAGRTDPPVAWDGGAVLELGLFLTEGACRLWPMQLVASPPRCTAGRHRLRGLE